MPRRTRAAARAEAALAVQNPDGSHKEHDFPLLQELGPTTQGDSDQPDRTPLAEIDNNSVDGSGDSPTQEKAPTRKSTRKGKKQVRAIPARAETEDLERSDDVAPVEQESTMNSDITQAQFAKGVETYEAGLNPLEVQDVELFVAASSEPGDGQKQFHNEFARPQTRALRSRDPVSLQPGDSNIDALPSQSVTAVTESMTEVPQICSVPEQPQRPDFTTEEAAATDINEPQHTLELPTTDAPPGVEADLLANVAGGQPEPTSMVVVEDLQKTSLASPPLSRSGTPRSASRSPLRPITLVRPERSIEAIDALEEALESLGKSFESPRVCKVDNTIEPSLGHDDGAQESALLKRVAQPTGSRKVKATTAAANGTSRQASGSKVAVAGAPSKPTSVRPRSYHGNAMSGLGVAQSAQQAAATATEASNKTVDYLASRRRPISMQFPTPPPPSKSSKPLTKSTFILPGEAVAAKLKAAREQRLKQQEEAEKKLTGAPNSINNKMVPSVFTKQTAASRARQSLVLSGDAAPGVSLDTNKENSLRKSMSTRDLTVTKRASMTFSTAQQRLSKTPSMSTLPGTLKTKRSSVLLPRSQAPAQAVVGKLKARQSPTIDSVDATGTMQRLSATSTLQTHSSGTGVPPAAATSKATVSATDAVLQRAKGREVFNRDKLEKEARDLERKTKEEAARKARAEAADRSRQLSRQWKEKQEKLKARRKAEIALTGQALSAAPVGMREEGRMSFKAL